MASITTGLIEKVQIDSNAEQNIASTAYGECTTDAGSAAKTVEMTGFSLLPGVTVHIKFIHANTVANPTLNINSTGAKPIVQFGTTAIDTDDETNGWHEGAVLTLTYDGTSWVRDQGYNTDTIYIHPTTDGNLHVPAVGTNNNGKFLKAGNIEKAFGWSFITKADITDFEHSHILSLAEDSGTSALTLAFGQKYKLTAGGSTYIFTLPAMPTVADLNLSNAMHFIGVATVAITDGSTTDPVISGYSTKTAGDVIIDKDSSREYVWSTTNKWELLGSDSSYKTVQTAVSSPTASGSTTSFIDTISQNENGVITVTKKNLDTSGTWSGTAAQANYLHPFTDGTNASGTTDIQILTTLQADDNIPRSAPFGVLLQHGNHSVGFGYFYPKSSQYGGWYIANYGGPSYIGLNNGTWKTYTFLTNQNYTSYAVAKTAGVTAVTWDSTNNKLTRTINGTAADVVTAAQISTALGLGTIASKAENDYMKFGGDDANLGSGSPAATAKTYWADTTKVSDNMITGYYNHSGTEYSLLFSKRSTYGTILKWTYNDTYIRILRIQSGTWKSDDWEKISAGYADSAGTATTATNLANNPSIQTSGTTQITITAGGKTSGAYTVPYATSATTATYIRCRDTRDTALNPTDLDAATGVRFDFKAKATINLTATDAYAGVMSFRPYAKNTDWSGGNAHQLAFNSEGLHWRNGSASWGDWYQILDSDNTAAGANATATLAWGGTYTLAKINGTDIKITTMAQPSYAFADLTAHPTTLSGYGITDAASSDHSHTLKIGNKSLSVSTSEQEWTVHDILYSSSHNIGTDTSWDITEPGVYSVASSSAFTGEQNPSSNGDQSAPYTYGHAFTIRASNGGASQFYINHNASDSKHSSRGIRYRSGWNVINNPDANHWRSWATILDDKNFNLYAPTLTGTGASGTWDISITGSSASCTGNAATATAIETAGTTAQFYRGDNTWSDTISGGTFKITNNNNTLTIGSTNNTQCHFSNSLNIPFYFNNSIELNGSLGTDDYPANALYIGAQDDRSIYFTGTRTTDAMLTFLDNTINNSGNGIKIEGNTAVLGAGKSATHLPVDANTGTLFLLSDGAINIEAGGSTITNRVGIQITSAGNIIPVKAEAANTNKQNLGAVDNVWANVFATNFIGALDGNATSADRFSTARKLGVALGSTTAVTFNGSADQLSIPVSGTLAVGHGGTGATSFTANSLIISGATTTSALTTRAIQNMTTVSHLGWTTAAAGIEIPTVNTLAYWNGQFKSGSSNLQYCKLGQFGDMATKTATDYVLRAGDTMLGMLTIKGLKGTSNVDYGTALPTSGTNGQIFFQLSDPYYEIPAGGTTGQVLMKHSDSSRDVYWGTPSAGGILRPDTTTKYYVAGSSLTVENTDPALFNTSIYVQNSVLFGAAWNDYAEYRQTTETIEPGRCVIEDGTDALHLSSARMQAGAEIVSDTYGFAIGQTEKCNTPIAVTGRVLAYPYDDLDKYKPGTPVCSGPEGTVSVMTEEEARQYPWLIIGTVSAIPTYEEWGTNHIKINGRIWIRIR